MTTPMRIRTFKANRASLGDAGWLRDTINRESRKFDFRVGSRMWRYKLVRMDLPGWQQAEITACEARLNELGGEGWEALAVIERADGWLALFKMPHEVGTF